MVTFQEHHFNDTQLKLSRVSFLQCWHIGEKWLRTTLDFGWYHAARGNYTNSSQTLPIDPYQINAQHFLNPPLSTITHCHYLSSPHTFHSLQWSCSTKISVAAIRWGGVERRSFCVERGSWNELSPFQLTPPSLPSIVPQIFLSTLRLLAYNGFW